MAAPQPPAVKRPKSPIQRIFADIPATYERVNHLLTLGLDVAWRRRAVRLAAAGPPGIWADMCTGTGEMATYLKRRAPEGTRVCGIDFSLPMLSEARRKKIAVDFAASDIKALPFGDDTFDVITMSFATRNINLSREALLRSFAEYHRVLKPGGRFVNLETSQPRWSWMRKLVHLYVKLVVEAIGSLISGSRAPYAYLAHTIPRFYTADELAGLLRQAGFTDVRIDRCLGSVAAIHMSRKG